MSKVFILMLFMLVLSSAANAAYPYPKGVTVTTREEAIQMVKNACDKDANRLCSEEELVDEELKRQCLVKNKLRLSKTCRRAIK